MTNVMDIVIRATDKASSVIKGVGKTGKTTGGWLEKNWAAVGVATAGAGLALEGLARQQAPLTEKTRRLADSLGKTEKEMRALAIETSDVTFPLDQVLGLMEKGRQRGLEGAEALQKYALFWDKVGDATGLSSEALAKAGVALGSVGIAAGEESKALAAFGFVTEYTTGTVDDFLRFIARAGPQLSEMGLTVDDTAAIVGILEREMHMCSRTAKTEFRRAVEDSDGSVEKLKEMLGITEEQFSRYSEKVEESSGIIQRNADTHYEGRTMMEKAQHAASELTYKYGDLIGAVSSLTPIMVALGPIIKGVSAAKGVMTGIMAKTTIGTKALTIATKALIVVKGILLSPIFLVVAAIAALVLAGVLLVRNWDRVRAAGAVVWQAIANAARGPVNTLIGFANAVITAFERMLNAVAGAINRIPTFSIPDWIPIIGGRSFSLPRVPTVSLPRIPTLHQGGVFRAPTPGGEGLALLRDRERVLPVGHIGGQGAQILFARGAFEGAIIMDDYGVDRLMDRVVERLAALGVTQ